MDTAWLRGKGCESSYMGAEEVMEIACRSDDVALRWSQSDI
jgi:hypothetical protein